MQLQPKLRSCGGGLEAEQVTHPDLWLNLLYWGMARLPAVAGVPLRHRTAQDLQAVAAPQRRAPELPCCRRDASDRA